MEKNEIVRKDSAVLVPENPPSQSLIQMLNAGNGTQIHTVSGDYVVNLILRTAEDISAVQELIKVGKDSSCTLAELAIMNQDKFNVFVLENEDFKNGVFNLTNGKCLKKHISKENLKKYGKGDPAAFAELKTFPCIFATRNLEYKKTSEYHVALLGRLAEITPQRGHIKFSFNVCKEVNQNKLNRNMKYLGMFERDARNELDDEGWSVKDGCLLNNLRTIGVEL